MNDKEFYDTLHREIWNRNIPAEDFNTKLTREAYYKYISKFDGTVLNLGCGKFNNYTLFRNFKLVVGVDISIIALKNARKNGIKNLVNADITCLPFKNNSFNLIFTDQVLEHITDLNKVLREIKRVGKNFIIGVPNEKLISQRIVNKIIGFNPATIGHVNLMGPEDWRKRIERHLEIDDWIGLKLFNLISFPTLRRFHRHIYRLDKRVNCPSFSFYLIFTGRCS